MHDPLASENFRKLVDELIQATPYASTGLGDVHSTLVNSLPIRDPPACTPGALHQSSANVSVLENCCTLSLSVNLSADREVSHVRSRQYKL